MRNSNGSIDVPATLPGVAHEVLIDNAIIGGDLLYRDNELACRWIAEEDWTFSAAFVLDSNMDSDRRLLAHDAHPVLRLDGVDTIASIEVNGEVVGKTASTFLRYELDLRPGLLRRGTNSLVVRFTSALTAARERSAQYPYGVPHTHYHHVWSEPSHRNFVRKPASDFGWDWGPSFVPTGLLGRVELASRFEGIAELEDVAIAQTHHENGTVSLRVYGWVGGMGMDDGALDGLRLSLTLCYPGARSRRRFGMATGRS